MNYMMEPKGPEAKHLQHLRSNSRKPDAVHAIDFDGIVKSKQPRSQRRIKFLATVLVFSAMLVGLVCCQVGSSDASRRSLAGSNRSTGSQVTQASVRLIGDADIPDAEKSAPPTIVDSEGSYFRINFQYGGGKLKQMFNKECYNGFVYRLIKPWNGGTASKWGRDAQHNQEERFRQDVRTIYGMKLDETTEKYVETKNFIIKPVTVVNKKGMKSKKWVKQCGIIEQRLLTPDDVIRMLKEREEVINKPNQFLDEQAKKRRFEQYTMSKKKIEAEIAKEKKGYEKKVRALKKDLAELKKTYELRKTAGSSIYKGFGGQIKQRHRKNKFCEN